MAGVGCCRRRRVRPALQYLLIAFFLFNFCLAIIFFQRIYGDSSRNKLEREEVAQPLEETTSPSAADSEDPHELNEVIDRNNNDFMEEKEKGDKNDFADYEVPLSQQEEKRNDHDVESASLQASTQVSDSRNHHSASVSSFKSEVTSDKDSTRQMGLLENISGSSDHKLMRLYEARAKEPLVFNWNLLKGKADVILAVQIHDRASYLAYLFESFRRVRNWNGTVIVLSHDYYSAEIDALIRNCTFAPIIDIYFPVPNQIFKTRFPGEDPRDCKRDMNPESAKKHGCYNANYPDTYGHYREARFSQTKHHWIWKLHYIFDEVIPKKMPRFDGQVLLLEEDHYVSPDFLHVLRQAAKLTAGTYRIITLGNYKDMKFGEAAHNFATNKWVSSRLNMGMSLTGATWKLIKGCVKTFCDFDDYNWDWSLQFTAIQCIEGNLYTLYARSSRIFHVGECAGIHFKNKCIASEKVESIKKMLSDNAASLFPSALEIETGVSAISQLRPKANGGWGDPRDRVLCRALASGSYSDILKSVDRAQTEPI